MTQHIHIDLASASRINPETSRSFHGTRINSVYTRFGTEAERIAATMLNPRRRGPRVAKVTLRKFSWEKSNEQKS